MIDGFCPTAPTKYGTIVPGGGSPPASNNNTPKCSDNLSANTQPAEPPPTVKTNNSRFYLLSFMFETSKEMKTSNEKNFNNFLCTSFGQIDFKHQSLPIMKS